MSFISFGINALRAHRTRLDEKMQNIFILTASHATARENFNNTVLRSVNEETALRALNHEEAEQLRNLAKSAGGYYLWGFKDEKNSKRLWERMSLGDPVLFYFEKAYRHLTSIVFKAKSETLASEIWLPDKTRVFKNIIFLDSGMPVNVPSSTLEDYLNMRYMGSTRIGDKKRDKILNDFGSLERLLLTKLGAKS